MGYIGGQPYIPAQSGGFSYPSYQTQSPLDPGFASAALGTSGIFPQQTVTPVSYLGGLKIEWNVYIMFL